MYVEEESGGITEKTWLKEYTDGLVVVRETATAMACMRLVKRNVVVHFWPSLNAKFISLRSGFTSLSMVLSDDLPQPANHSHEGEKICNRFSNDW